jgi:hypothetical protein
MTTGFLGWTRADEAELDCIVHELVKAAWAHRDCARCKELGTWCPPMRDAAEAALEWRRARRLLSKAAFLRHLQDREDAA